MKSRMDRARERTHGRRRQVTVLAAVVLGGIATLALWQPGGAQPARASTTPPSTGATARPAVPPAHHVVTPTLTTPATADPATTTTPATVPAPTTPESTPTTPATVPAPAPAAAPVAPVAASTTEPPIATLVAEVEAAGIEPGASWSWRMGDTATQCGVIPGDKAGTGCTSGAAGAATTVFAGAPSLALVAHELADAETENDAVPSLMAEVTTAEAGTSWSSIDAVASCLVVNFMGFQDDAAGSWQCPLALAAVVAANIHDSVSAVAETTPN
jgi:hypothetical protein